VDIAEKELDNVYRQGNKQAVTEFACTRLRMQGDRYEVPTQWWNIIAEKSLTTYRQGNKQVRTSHLRAPRPNRHIAEKELDNVVPPGQQAGVLQSVLRHMTGRLGPTATL
jgi:hypothetical protein